MDDGAGYIGLWFGLITIALGILVQHPNPDCCITGVCLLVLAFAGLGKVSSPPLDEVFSYIAL